MASANRELTRLLRGALACRRRLFFGHDDVELDATILRELFLRLGVGHERPRRTEALGDQSR